jgi:hypothetical protein
MMLVGLLPIYDAYALKRFQNPRWSFEDLDWTSGGSGGLRNIAKTAMIQASMYLLKRLLRALLLIVSPRQAFLFDSYLEFAERPAEPILFSRDKAEHEALRVAASFRIAAIAVN